MRNIFLILLLMPFIFAGSFQSYTEKTSPESTDIFLILDNDDLATKKVKVGNIGSGINWSTINIQASGINWSSLNQDIQTGGVNWASLNMAIQKDNVNWTSLNDSIQTAGVNWDSLSNDIQYSGVNWTSANIYTSGTKGNVGVGSNSANAKFEVVGDGVAPAFNVSSSSTSNGDFLNIQSDGRIGIGTVNSTTNGLHIVNHELIFLTYESNSTSRATNSTYQLQYDTNASVPFWVWKSRSGAAGQAFSPNSGGYSTAAILFDNNRNVGMGTFAPSSTLEISKVSTIPLLKVSSGGANKGDYLIVTSSGNIGIGSTAPNGSFVIRSSTNDIGWSKQSGANTACNTTCTASCVFGQNTGDMSIVDCADATADVCICAGSN